MSRRLGDDWAFSPFWWIVLLAALFAIIALNK